MLVRIMIVDDVDINYAPAILVQHPLTFDILLTLSTMRPLSAVLAKSGTAGRCLQNTVL